MTKLTPFAQLLDDAEGIAAYICTHFRTRHPFPISGSPAFREAVNHAVMHYLVAWMQSDDYPKTSIYLFAHEHYGDAADLDYIQRRLYWNRNQMLKYRNGNVPEKHDPADLLAIQNRMEQKGSLTDLASHGKIYHANYVSNAKLATAYQRFDEQYTAAAKTTDDTEYFINSIHFYRIEQSFAFSLIAQIAQYMKDHKLDSLNPSVALAFWAGSHVENMDEDASSEITFFAPQNVLTCHRHIPSVLSGLMPSDLQWLLRQERAYRTLEQNVFERLPLPSKKYGSFDATEIADFIRSRYPILESHVPVSFYQNEKPNYQKLRLLRYTMKQFYTTQP